MPTRVVKHSQEAGDINGIIKNTGTWNSGNLRAGKWGGGEI